MSRENTRTNPIIIVFIIISVVLIGGLVRNALSLYRARERLELVKQQVAELEAKKEVIENKMKVQTDPTALDQAIRNNLNLAKPGETIVIVSGSPSAAIATPEPPFKQSTAPIQLWWEVLNPSVPTTGFGPVTDRL